MTRTVTKATAIQFIDSKCHIMSRKTALSGYYACVSCDLLLMASGAETHMYQRVNKNDFKKPGAHGLWPCAPGLKIVESL